MKNTNPFVIVAVGLLFASGCQTPARQGPVSLSLSDPHPTASAPVAAAPAAAAAGRVAPTTPSAAARAMPSGVARSTGLEKPNANATIQQVGFRGHTMNPCGNCGNCPSCHPGNHGQARQQPSTITPDLPSRPGIDPQEFLCNGGDLPPEARVLQDDSIGGLNPQDAIVHYTTRAGDIHIQPSNRTCIYSPRFGVVRQVSSAVAGEKAIGLRGTSMPIGPNGIGLNQPSLAVSDANELGRANVSQRIDAMRERNRGVPVDGVVQPVVAQDVIAILATLDIVALDMMNEAQIALLQRGNQAARSWMIRDAVEVMIESMHPPTLIRDASVEAFVEYDFPDAGRLEIVKVADRQDAQLGEVVTFAIHVRNVGDSEVKHVEIADSLVARLEYVEDSQTCDREASFETKTNIAGALQLKWKLAKPLAVGETARIEFKCRVR